MTAFPDADGARAAGEEAPVLSIRGLRIEAATRAGWRPVVDGIDLDVRRGECVGLVGESGCGKSLTALSVLRLLPERGVRLAGGRVGFEGEDLATLPAERLRRIRGRRVGMVFQEPMTSLNPVFAVGDQVAEVLRIHRGLSGASALAEAARLLDLVGIPGARGMLGRFPHELSGGQRQRVVIAVALACDPALLIADEPTTALDVTIQAQILELIDRLRRDRGMGVLLITHDLGVVSETCDRVAVMYAGRIVEARTAADLFARPRHPYTAALIATAPASNPPGGRLPAISGMVPPLAERGTGCAFAPRCPRRGGRCAEAPPLDALPDGPAAGRVACWDPVP
jgi:oligopeptide/dipeptide ABC transporter ATP-binding protein